VNHTLALLNDGTVKGWGYNASGQLGDGTTVTRLSPVVVSGLTQVVSISTGSHSLAVLQDGTVKAWGLNMDGELGDGTTTNRLTPIAVPGLSNVKAVAAGGGSRHS